MSLWLVVKAKKTPTPQGGNPFDLYAQGDDEETMKAREANPLVAAFDEYLQKAIDHDE